MTDLRQTYLDEIIFRTNMLLDAGIAATFAEIHGAIQSGKIIEWLDEKGADMSILLSETMSHANALVVAALSQASGARQGQERRKLGVENLGLCLLIALALEAKAISPPVASPYLQEPSVQ